MRSFLFFAVAAFLMDGLANVAQLNDAFFAHVAFQADQTEQGILGVLSAAGYATGCLLFGPLSERTGRRFPVILAITSNLVLLVILTRCESLAGLIALSAARKISLSMFWPVIMAWMADSSSPRTFAFDLCSFNIGWTIGAGTGGWAAGHIGHWAASIPGGYDPVAAYWVSAVVSVGLLAWVALLNPHLSGSRFHGPEPEPLSLETAKTLLALARLSNATVYALTSLVIYMLPRLADLPSIAISEGTQSDIFAVRTFTGLVIFILMLASRGWHGRIYPVFLCMAFCLFGMTMMAVAASFTIFLAGGVFIGVALGISYTISLYYSLSVPQTKGKGSAGHEALVGVGSAVGPMIGGLAAWIFDTPRAPFFAGIVLVLIVAAAAAFALRSDRTGG